MSSATRQSQKLLLFRLSGDRLFGLGTLKIREILPNMPLSKLPHSHPAIIGTASFRGSSVPVIDMAAAVGYGPLSAREQAEGTIIITDVQRQETGFLVRNVQQIIEADWKHVMPPPRALGNKAFITGLLDVDSQLVQLLDIEMLLAHVYPDSLSTPDITLAATDANILESLNILLVDDSLVARKQLSDVLDSKGIAYRVTTTGDRALHLLQDASANGQPVDILVSDIEMPGLDGYELTFNVRDQADMSQPYIILHTSLNSQMSLSYANQVGADEALTKFDAEELLQAILRGARTREVSGGQN